jgi:hypothetical protein
MSRSGVKSGDKSLEYEDGGEKDSKKACKKSDDGNANENLELAFPP